MNICYQDIDLYKSGNLSKKFKNHWWVSKQQLYYFWNVQFYTAVSIQLWGYCTRFKIGLLAKFAVLEPGLLTLSNTKKKLNNKGPFKNHVSITAPLSIYLSYNLKSELRIVKVYQNKFIYFHGKKTSVRFFLSISNGFISCKKF